MSASPKIDGYNIQCLDENLEILLDTRRVEILTEGVDNVFQGFKFQTNAVTDKMYDFRPGTI